MQTNRVYSNQQTPTSQQASTSPQTSANKQASTDPPVSINQQSSTNSKIDSNGWRGLQEKLETNKRAALDQFSRAIAEDLARLVESQSSFQSPNSLAKDLKSSR